VSGDEQVTAIYDSLENSPYFVGMKRSSIRKFVTKNFPKELIEIRKGWGSVSSLLHRAEGIRKNMLEKKLKGVRRVVIRCPLLPADIHIDVEKGWSAKDVEKLEDIINKVRRTTISYE
jgi:hypothetical protein